MGDPLSSLLSTLSLFLSLSLCLSLYHDTHTHTLSLSLSLYHDTLSVHFPALPNFPTSTTHHPYTKN